MVCYLLRQANTVCLEEGREHSLEKREDRPVAIRSKCASLEEKVY